MNILATIGAVITLIGSIFLLLASVGLLRMPDTYNRVQAGTKATTLGTILFLLGIGLIHPSWFGKMIVLILFVALTNPVSSHVLARSAHKSKVPMTNRTMVDKFDETNKSSDQKDAS